MDEQAAEQATTGIADTLVRLCPSPFWREVVSQIFAPDTLVGKLASTVVVLLVAVAAYWLAMYILGRARRRVQQAADQLEGMPQRRLLRAATALSIVGSAIKWVIALVAIIWVLGVLGIPILPLLTGVGFLGAAIAFGSQTLVKDLVSGLFLLLEGQYAEGDCVNLAGRFGRVEEIRFRTTVLRDLDNQLHHIPNGAITAVTVYEEPYVNYVLEVPLNSATDAERVRQGVDALARQVVLDYPLHITEIGAALVDGAAEGVSLVRLPVAVFPTQDWVATEELAARTQIMLDEMGITIAEKLKMRVYADVSEVSAHIEETKAAVRGTEVIPRR